MELAIAARWSVGVGSNISPSKLVKLSQNRLAVFRYRRPGSTAHSSCKPSGKIRCKKPPAGHCNIENDADCGRQGQTYTTYKCSPGVSKRTKAAMTINSFQKGGDGGGTSKCDIEYHSDDTPVVALSSGWFNQRSRCIKNTTIYGNGRSVQAMAVDECEPTMGWDKDHDFQPRCDDNIIDASRAVWEARRMPKSKRGTVDVDWSDS
ncbi:kiwellin-1-like [Coffea arabica]|uniref:Kiwellin-1-like n=1 Tax=Coffea arabica TaxID=13443 RepID=A0ABM4WNB9_COFAR